MERHYTYRVQWCPERLEYVARCLEFRGLYTYGMTAQEALARAEAEVEAEVAALDEGGLPAPTAITDQKLSGRIMVRTSRTLHARLLIEATEEGVSLNQWMVQKLADRKPSLDW